MTLHWMEAAARREWTSWIGSGGGSCDPRWQWFVTLTFAREVGDAVAIRALKRWAREVAVRALGGAHFALTYVMDRQPDSGRWHFHVLCSFGAVAWDPDPAWAPHLWRAISHRFPTGYADARRCDGTEAAIRYAFGHHGERGHGLVCSRIGECKRQNCRHGVSPWSRTR